MVRGGDRLCQTSLIPRSPDGDKNTYTYTNTNIDMNENTRKTMMQIACQPTNLVPAEVKEISREVKS